MKKVLIAYSILLCFYFCLMLRESGEAEELANIRNPLRFSEGRPLDLGLSLAENSESHTDEGAPPRSPMDELPAALMDWAKTHQVDIVARNRQLRDDASYCHYMQLSRQETLDALPLIHGPKSPEAFNQSDEIFSSEGPEPRIRKSWQSLKPLYLQPLKQYRSDPLDLNLYLLNADENALTELSNILLRQFGAKLEEHIIPRSFSPSLLVERLEDLNPLQWPRLALGLLLVGALLLHLAYYFRCQRDYMIARLFAHGPLTLFAQLARVHLGLPALCFLGSAPFFLYLLGFRPSWQSLIYYLPLILIPFIVYLCLSTLVLLVLLAFLRWSRLLPFLQGRLNRRGLLLLVLLLKFVSVYLLAEASVDRLSYIKFLFRSQREQEAERQFKGDLWRLMPKSPSIHFNAFNYDGSSIHLVGPGEELSHRYYDELLKQRDFIYTYDKDYKEQQFIIVNGNFLRYNQVLPEKEIEALHPEDLRKEGWGGPYFLYTKATKDRATAMQASVVWKELFPDAKLIPLPEERLPRYFIPDLDASPPEKPPLLILAPPLVINDIDEFYFIAPDAQRRQAILDSIQGLPLAEELQWEAYSEHIDSLQARFFKNLFSDAQYLFCNLAILAAFSAFISVFYMRQEQRNLAIAQLFGQGLWRNTWPLFCLISLPPLCFVLSLPEKYSNDSLWGEKLVLLALLFLFDLVVYALSLLYFRRQGKAQLLA